MAKQVTLADIKKCPQDFLYLFATKSFLAKIDPKSAAIISKKQDNQFKVLKHACEKENADYQATVKQLNQGLVDAFGYNATTILKMLAEGKTVAGKNWGKGIYGIGATTREGFAGTDVTVNKDTGKIYQGGTEVAGQTAIYGEGGTTTYTATIGDRVYSSQYMNNMYSAGTYTDADGKTFNAEGTDVGLGGFNNIWSAISCLSPIIEKLIVWLASLFPATFEGSSVISKTNTVPSQSDGFVQQSSIGTGLVFAGIAAAVYALAKRGGKGKKHSKSDK